MAASNPPANSTQEVSQHPWWFSLISGIALVVVGIALWIQRDWPWLTVGAGLMFIAAGAFASSVWSLPIANFGEICFTLGCISTAAHFARQDLQRRL